MEEVTNVSVTDTGDSNHTTSTLDSNNALSVAATTTIAGDREVNGSGHESNEEDVSKRNKDKKVSYLLNS